MKELRCLVFNDREVIKATTERRRRRGDPLPGGPAVGVTYVVTNQGIDTRLRFQDGGGGGETLLALTSEEVVGALVSLCKSRHIPLPAESDKVLYVIRGSLALMITMNFNKPVRLIQMGDPAGDDTPSPRTPSGRRRLTA